jgi:peptidoglycan/LPS O-acetylase OafA/YrhL
MESFRADVEGLRAVAIVIVVGELDRTGRVSVARSYARRVTRLMPQVLTVAAYLHPPAQRD